MGAVAVDVVDGFFDIRDDLDGQDEVQIFGPEVFICHDVHSVDGGRRFDGSDDQVLRLLCSAEPDRGGMKSPRQLGEEGGGDVSVDQDGFHCVAGCGVLGLGVEDDLDRHFLVGVAVHINVADAVRMAHDRNFCVVHDVLNKLVGAAGNEKVDLLFALQEFVDLIVELRLEQAGSGETGGNGGIADDGEQDAVGLRGLLSTLENGTVAALEAEGGDLYQGVGARLKDDPDDADRHADALEDESCVQLPLQKCPSDRVGEGDELIDPFADICELGLVEDKPLHDGLRDARLFGRPTVLCVCGKDRLLLCLQGLADRAQGCISLLIGGGSQNGRDLFHFNRFFTNIHTKLHSAA